MNNSSSPRTYFHLSKHQHQHLQKLGQQLFETIQATRKSRQDVPSTLLTVVRHPSDVPDVTPVQKKIYRLEQQVLALEKELAATTTMNPSPTTPQRKSLRPLDKEGALHQENTLLRRQLHKTTQEKQHLATTLGEMETKIKHLDAKLQLFRIELQRKDQQNKPVNPQHKPENKQQEHQQSASPSVALLGPVLRQNERHHNSENQRLRQLLDERNALTTHLKTDLERMATERMLSRKKNRALEQQIRGLLVQRSGQYTSTTKESTHNNTETIGGAQEPQLGVESDHDDDEQSEVPTGFLDIWAEVLWGK
tara:strand:+ start:64 stop:987 length:924 start_codon:yes stop_codon:yes gene_type:complete